MLFFKKKSNPLPDLSFLGIDMHSHLIPGIDDGSQDAESSIELIKGMIELGYQKLITTPHVLWDMFPNTEEKILNGFLSLQEEINTAGVQIETVAAAEYYLDDHFEGELKAKTPLLKLNSNLVLVEFSMITAPLDLQDLLFETQLQGYQPVIAHPERYAYLSRKREFFDELKDSGCYFQLNLLSLGGHYGAVVQELAEYLLKKEYYDLAGSDLHGQRHLEGLRRLPPATVNRLKDYGFKNNELLV